MKIEIIIIRTWGRVGLEIECNPANLTQSKRDYLNSLVSAMANGFRTMITEGSTTS